MHFYHEGAETLYEERKHEDASRIKNNKERRNTVIETQIKGNKMVITADISDNQFKPSKSGKTRVVGTGGNIAVEGYKVGLNITKPAK